MTVDLTQTSKTKATGPSNNSPPASGKAPSDANTKSTADPPKGGAEDYPTPSCPGWPLLAVQPAGQVD